MALKRTKLSKAQGSCSTIMLRSFGIHVNDQVERYRSESMKILQDNGYTLEEVSVWDMWKGHYMTLSTFIRRYPHDSYYLSSKSHAMSLINGKLTDTDMGHTGRRRVIRAFRVSKQIGG